MVIHKQLTNNIKDNRDWLVLNNGFSFKVENQKVISLYIYVIVPMV